MLDFDILSKSGILFLSKSIKKGMKIKFIEKVFKKNSN